MRSNEQSTFDSAFSISPVKVWTLPAAVDLSAEFSVWAEALLSPLERKHFAEITHSGRRGEFLLGHSLARVQIADFFNLSPSELPIQFNRDQKPTLGEIHSSANSGPWFVSLTHCSNLIACALSKAPVGIDVESLGRQRNFAGIAQRRFRSEELDYLQLQNKNGLEQRFQRIWTLKEAFYKAANHSVETVYDHCAFSIGDSDQVTCHSSPEVGGASKDWKFFLSTPTSEHVLALAVQAPYQPDVQYEHLTLKSFIERVRLELPH